MKEQIIIIVPDRRRSPHDAGNIFRTAEALGAAEIIACGRTSVPPRDTAAFSPIRISAAVSFFRRIGL